MTMRFPELPDLPAILAALKRGESVVIEHYVRGPADRHTLLDALERALGRRPKAVIAHASDCESFGETFDEARCTCPRVQLRIKTTSVSGPNRLQEIPRVVLPALAGRASTGLMIALGLVVGFAVMNTVTSGARFRKATAAWTARLDSLIARDSVFQVQLAESRAAQRVAEDSAVAAQGRARAAGASLRALQARVRVDTTLPPRAVALLDECFTGCAVQATADSMAILSLHVALAQATRRADSLAAPRVDTLTAAIRARPVEHCGIAGIGCWRPLEKVMASVVLVTGLVGILVLK